MRVALISNTLPPEGRGGAEAYVADLAQELAERGHDVVVLTGARAPRPVVPVISLPGLAPLDPHANPARKAAWHALDQWLPSVHSAVKRELARFRPDVVHTHAVQGLSAAVFTAIRGLGLRHVHTAHDLGLLCARVTMTRDGEFCGGRSPSCLVQRAIRARAAASRLDLLVAPSDHIRRRHVEFGLLDEAKTLTIRQGTSPAEPVERPVASPERPRVGYLGSLSPVKGIETLLNAFATAPAHWRLAVAGSGELEPLVVGRAAVDDRVEFLGHLDGARKDAFLAELDVIVIPSEWEENAPLVAVEAAVRGLPAVVSDRGGLPELPGVEVFRARDREALVAAVARLVDRPDRLRELSRSLIDSHDGFLWKTHATQIERVLAQVASAR